MNTFKFGLLLVTTLVASTATFVHANSDTTESSKTAPPLLSDQEFALQKDQMTKDLAEKIQVLQTAHDCAKAAENPDAFAKCNKSLRDAILNKKPKSD